MPVFYVTECRFAQIVIIEMQIKNFEEQIQTIRKILH